MFKRSPAAPLKASDDHDVYHLATDDDDSHSDKPHHQQQQQQYQRQHQHHHHQQQQHRQEQARWPQQQRGDSYGSMGPSNAERAEGAAVNEQKPSSSVCIDMFTCRCCRPRATQSSGWWWPMRKMRGHTETYETHSSKRWGAANAVFRPKVTFALRAALATFAITELSLYYKWSKSQTWYSVIVAIICVRTSLGETLMTCSTYWYPSVPVALPLIYLVSLVQFNKVLIGIAIFVCAMIILTPQGRSVVAKRTASYYVISTVLYSVTEPEVTYGNHIAHTLLCVAVAHAFAIAAMLLPVPALAVTTTRRRLDVLRKVMASLLETCHLAFELNEEVHFSTIDQLLEGLSAVVSSVQSQLPYVRHEMMLLRCGRDSGVHDRLAALLSVVQKQSEILSGMRASLKRLIPNATHRAYLTYLYAPLVAVMHASTDVVDEVIRCLQSDLYVCCWSRRYDSESTKQPQQQQPQQQQQQPQQRPQQQYQQQQQRQHQQQQQQQQLQQHQQQQQQQQPPHHDHQQPNTHSPLKPPADHQPDPRHRHLTSLLDTVYQRVEDLVRGVMEARIRIIYGMVPVVEIEDAAGDAHDDTADVSMISGIVDLPTPRSRTSGTRSTDGSNPLHQEYLKDLQRHGMSMNLPRNAFLLDLDYFVRTLPEMIRACDKNDDKDFQSHFQTDTFKPSRALWGCGAICASLRAWLMSTFACGIGGNGKLWTTLRQPFKISVALVITSLGVLHPQISRVLGPKTYWASITITKILSPFPSSSFNSATNRIQGTALGSVFGLALTEWLGIREGTGVAVLLGIWVFFCGFARLSPKFGEAGSVAAITAPLITIGPMVGSQGAIVRIEEIILGVVVYVLMDNLVWPARAKLDLRREMASALEDFKALWSLTLSIFLHHSHESGLDAVQPLRSRLAKSFAAMRKHIELAVDEPELWHKPFNAASYRSVVDSLAKASKWMSMLCRASTAAARTTHTPREVEVLNNVQQAVEKVDHAIEEALEEAKQALFQLSQNQDDDDASAPPTPLTCSEGRRVSGQTGRHVRRVKSWRSLQLFRVKQAQLEMQDHISQYLMGYVMSRAQSTEGVELTRYDFMLSLYGVILGIEGMTTELLQLAHAIRELIEREKGQLVLV